MKKLGLSLSMLWLFIAIAICVSINCTTKFLTVDTFESIVILIVLFLTPIFFILYYLLPERYQKGIIDVAFLALFVLNILYLLFSSGLNIYPMNVSETKDYSNYLVFNEDSDSIELIKDVFPNKIPQNAKNIEYDYKAYPSKNSMYVQAFWVLPEREYESEIQRVQLIAEKNLVYDNVTYYYINIDDGYCHICFDEENMSVSYFADINDCCNWQYISWIKTEFKGA